MVFTQSAFDWLRSRVGPPAPGPDVPDGPARERTARVEIDRLRTEIEELVTARAVTARGALDSALDAVARLQVVTSNLDACRPPKGDHLGKALVAFADQRLHGHADAIERGMTYTADNTLRMLRGDAH